MAIPLPSTSYVVQYYLYMSTGASVCSRFTMTTNMTGLASLALAMAHLDEGIQAPLESTTCIAESCHAESRQQSYHPPGIPLPSRRAFPPRVVSIENENGLKSDSEVEDMLMIFDQSSEPPPAAPSPTEVIAKVQEADVLCGRGGETNHHAGNIYYRHLVKKYQRLYLKAKRRDKPKIARHIVDSIRRNHGRFLKKDASSNTFRDVGNTKAREKTSQALREGAPEMRHEDTAMPNHAHQGQFVDAIVGSKKRKLLTPTILPNYTMANLVSPTPSSGSFQESYISPRVTVSVEHDAVTTEQHPWDKPYISMNKKTVRGPRLAILKARLQSQDSD